MLFNTAPGDDTYEFDYGDDDYDPSQDWWTSKGDPKSAGGGGGSWVGGTKRSVSPDGSSRLDGEVEFEFVANFDETTISQVTLDSCGTVGSTGPSDCTTFWANKLLPSGLNINTKPTNGIQEVTFTEDAIWEISAGGARGGFHVGIKDVAHETGYVQVPTLEMGGAGATATGTFKFQKGDKINVVVGQHSSLVGGMIQTGCATCRAKFNHGAGGGGGSFVYRVDEKQPLVVAGGGGGAATHYEFLPGTGTGSETGGSAEYEGGKDGKGGDGPTVDNLDSLYGGGSGAGWSESGICTKTKSN